MVDDGMEREQNTVEDRYAYGLGASSHIIDILLYFLTIHSQGKRRNKEILALNSELDTE